MRRRSSLAVLLGLGLACGCGKKPAPPDPAPGADQEKGAAPAPAAAADAPGAWRNKQLAALKARQDAPRRAAVDELSFLVLEDPETGPALIELLRDKGTNGPGHTLGNQINSTREAAAAALLKAGPKGEALLKEKGLPILRAGLTDPAPVVREHSAYTIGQLGPLAHPLAADVQKLCTDPDAHVRPAAFDALRATGVADPVALAALLTHENEEVARLAAELVGTVEKCPPDATGPLAAALKSANPNVRRAAADALGAMGPAAGPAVPDLIALLQTIYKDRDPKQPRTEEFGPEAAAWSALGRIGEAAVGPTAKLLDEPSPLLQYYALRALGDLGPLAKPAAGAVKKRLQDRFADNALEAAYALLRMDDSKDDALALLKRGLDSDAPGVAALAVQVVGRAGPAAEPLIPVVLTKLTSPDRTARAATLDLIAARPIAERAKLAAEIGALAADEEPTVRRRAARVLTQLGPDAAPGAGALGKALPDEKDSAVRGEFIAALLAMGPGAKPAVPALLPLIGDTDLFTAVRARVIAALVVADPGSPEVAAALVKAVADKDPTVRAAAATALGRVDPLPPNALSTLVKTAKSDSTNGPRVAALRALAVAGSRARPARPDVEAMTAGPQAGLAFWAKVALAAVDGDLNKSAPLVRAGLSDRNAAVRTSAAEAVLLIGPTNEDLPALLKLLKEPGPSTRTAAASALGRLGPVAGDAVPQLVRLLSDPESEVRIPAAEALGRIGPAAQPGVRKLKELLRDPLVWATAQRALGQIEGK